MSEVASFRYFKEWIYFRQHRTKHAWRLCTKSAYIFSVISHRSSLKCDSIPALFLYNLMKNLNVHLSHKLCAVLPLFSIIGNGNHCYNHKFILSDDTNGIHTFYIWKKSPEKGRIFSVNWDKLLLSICGKIDHYRKSWFYKFFKHFTSTTMHCIN